jgi:hypothetical protein
VVAVRGALIWVVLAGGLGACSAARPLGPEGQDGSPADVAAHDGLVSNVSDGRDTSSPVEVSPMDVVPAVDVASVLDGSADVGTEGGVGTVVPPCISTSAASDAMDATRFCKIFLATCGTGQVGYTTFAECLVTYGGTPPHRRQCQSYHVCNAVQGLGSNRVVHCGHAAGLTVVPSPTKGPCHGRKGHVAGFASQRRYRFVHDVH